MRNFDALLRETHKGVVRVRAHMDKWANQIRALEPRPQTNDRDIAILSAHLRSHAWMVSLTKLNHASDLQAVACGCRSLLESVVDMALLASDSTNRSGEKIRWWDLSARYQMAVSFLQYEPTGKSADLARDFMQRNKTFVEGLRTNLWPQWKNRHPRRWTGSNDIKPDILTVDGGPFAEVIRQNLRAPLFDYYATEYQRLNKTIHASGRLGVEGSPQLISLRAAQACWSSASLAMICHQVLCIDRWFGGSIVGRMGIYF